MRGQSKILTEAFNLMHARMQDRDDTDTDTDTDIAIGKPAPMDKMVFISKTIALDVMGCMRNPAGWLYSISAKFNTEY